MIDGKPSGTARGVAAIRSKLERPASPSGDPASELKLYETLIAEINRDVPRDPRRVHDLGMMMAVRTRFFDQTVVDALANGINQIVILGAGYDGRALRFRTPGVRFFEVDHPATQADKRARLAAVNARVDDITFVAADLTHPGLADTLARWGHNPVRPTQWLCEGLLRYLPEAWVRALFDSSAICSAPGSVFAASVATRVAGSGHDDPARLQREQELAKAGEPVLTVPTPEVALGWLESAGWKVQGTAEMNTWAPGMRPGRLLVTATR